MVPSSRVAPAAPSSRRRSLLARSVAFTSLLALCAAGCGRVYESHVLPTTSPTTVTIALPTATTGPDAYERSGRTTQLRLTLPAATTPRPFPLVVALHSLRNTSTEPQSQWGFDALAVRAGFAVAYPDGLNASWDAGTCCGQSAAEHVDDVGWLRALISHLEQHYPIDRQRVILTGFSNGGMIAYRYACEHAAEIAGIAVVAASLQVADCAPAKPVTVVAIHGQLDERVPYTGDAWSEALGTPLQSVRRSLSPFRASAGCPEPSPPQDTVMTNSDGVAIGDTAGSLPVGLDGAEVTDTTGPGVDQDTSRDAPQTAGPTSRTRRTPAGRATGTPSASTSSDKDTAIKRETACSSGERIVEFLLPGVAHGWPPVTGPKRFDTAEVIWRLLAPMRSSTPGPDL
ncbi:putative hydrolase/esterase LpqP [Candidatus Protofrankia californiensis]|uniref:Putative hydrolase/esterase LpqP n=1 Tax=Candidatus Protofrankia californiensis TaxID=1839754 RepID=A0A1C3NTB7_9ACTN|nr:putative hydrolase/esterase LpqP [Candidatus Protofrankia californiensis]